MVKMWRAPVVHLKKNIFILIIILVLDQSVIGYTKGLGIYDTIYNCYLLSVKKKKYTK